MKCIQFSFNTTALRCADAAGGERTTSGSSAKKKHMPRLPLWLKSPSISMDDLECAMQSMEQGTMPSWAGERSVVRTRHQSGLSWSRSRTSTVWPRRTVSSPLLPLVATKSWMTTVSSHPPDNWEGSRRRVQEFRSVKCYFILLSGQISLW